MKTCQKCGSQNEDEAKFCISCGNTMQTLASTESQLDYHPTENNASQQTNDENASQQTSNNQSYQTQNYQQTYKPQNQKNKWIAVILDLIGGIILYILCGLGQLYLGLYKRGIFLGICGLMITVIGIILQFTVSELVGTAISLIIGIIFTIYCAFDASQCTNAINEGRAIPPLFGSIELE